jgi:TPR repeat protein
VPKDYSKAMELLTKSAEQGYAPAQYSLGNAYYLGHIGQTKDYVHAYAWFNVFAANAPHGRWMGEGQKDDLEKLMSPEQIAEAQSLSIELQAKIDAARRK